jgi:hypothetical protein
MQKIKDIKAETNKWGNTYWTLWDSKLYVLRCEQTKTNKLVLCLYSKVDDKINFQQKIFLGLVFKNSRFNFMGTCYFIDFDNNAIFAELLNYKGTRDENLETEAPQNIEEELSDAFPF